MKDPMQELLIIALITASVIVFWGLFIFKFVRM